MLVERWTNCDLGIDLGYWSYNDCAKMQEEFVLNVTKGR